MSRLSPRCRGASFHGVQGDPYSPSLGHGRSKGSLNREEDLREAEARATLVPSLQGVGRERRESN